MDAENTAFLTSISHILTDFKAVQNSYTALQETLSTLPEPAQSTLNTHITELQTSISTLGATLNRTRATLPPSPSRPSQSHVTYVLPPAIPLPLLPHDTLSPPPTQVPLSPLPPANITNAGSTPGPPSDDNTPTQRSYNDSRSDDIPLDTDTDPALRGPLTMLDSPDFAARVDEKLRELSRGEDGEGVLPTVLLGMEVEIGIGEGLKVGIEGESGTEVEVVEDAETGLPIKQKLGAKRSLNFEDLKLHRRKVSDEFLV
ncbi:hypothetical protein M501DRAFT_1018662 [Patellaria atrata CBS 101060]|uniref:Uncharacterized protein n=1 Tax=Patellaria atrata CBS 101060 TaxID=1346257 RepID=A0A9P4S7V0_9PEZI|nr:hypothetical protein M501DRAFT_1018662 [Patellaria atrata CBS 101060]